MKDFIYIDMLSQELKDTLSKKQAFSMKALKDGFWGISPDYKDFLDGVDIVFDSEKNTLTFTYKDNSIRYKIIYNYNYVFKIKHFKSINKLFTNDFNELYDMLINKADAEANRYITNTIYRAVFKQLNGITFDDIYVADRSYINSLLDNDFGL